MRKRTGEKMMKRDALITSITSTDEYVNINYMLKSLFTNGSISLQSKPQKASFFKTCAIY